MTQGNPLTALEMAEEAYRLRFGEFAPVWGFLAHPRLADELLAAVKRGEKLTADMLGVRLKVPPSPPGAFTSLPPTNDTLPAPDDQDAFQAALDRYSATFPGKGLPFLRGVNRQNQAVVIATLDAAVKAGRPLDWWSVMRALGYPDPPPGVCL